MTRAEMREYKDKKPIAVYPMSNWGGVEILDIIYGIDDYVVARFNFGDGDVDNRMHRYKIKYNKSGIPFFSMGGNRVRLDECMRV